MLWFLDRGKPVKGNHMQVESVGGEGLRVVVDVAINLTEATGWIMKERNRIGSPG